MSPLFIAIFSVVLLLTLIFCGIHLSTSLMFTSVVTVFLFTGRFKVAMNVLAQSAWGAVRQYMFGVIPLFVLMGMFANLSGTSKDLYDSTSLLLKKVRGGVGIATVIANAIFAAITGVTVASAAIFTKIALPQMLRLNYNKKFALGTIAGSAILGMLIPPSLLMIVYGSQADVSIGKLFVAAIMPGIIMTIAFIIVIMLVGKIKPQYIPEVEELTEEEKKNFWKIVFKPWPIVVLIIITLGGIWGGFFTPTEAGGVGAFGSLLIVLFKKGFKPVEIWETLLAAGSTSGSVLILLISASTYSKTLSMCGIINTLNSFVNGINVPSIGIILIFILILMVLGCILDSTSILLLTTPLMCPIVRDMGYDMVWFGLVMIIAIETGMITPPFGMNVFTVKSSLHGIKGNEDVTVNDIFAGSLWFLIAIVIVDLICIFFPIVVTYLPNHM
ncbi:TRAP transporter large permease [Treponema sp. SP13]|uniref:TRAP transporter large permease n=1 Tax=Treponema sp. SP13 TaxID=2789742 RepID=UPI003D8BE90C